MWTSYGTVAQESLISAFCMFYLLPHSPHSITKLSDVSLLFQMWTFLPVSIMSTKMNNLNILLTCLSVTNQLSVAGSVILLKQKKKLISLLTSKFLFVCFLFLDHKPSKSLVWQKKVLHCLAPFHLYSLFILRSLSTSYQSPQPLTMIHALAESLAPFASLWGRMHLRLSLFQLLPWHLEQFVEKYVSCLLCT